MNQILLIIFMGTFLFSQAQFGKLPIPVTNHSAAVLFNNNQYILYSFMGLDSGKTWKDVHRRVYKLNLSTNKSSVIGFVPDSVGRLASAASVIRNKAYIVGGYTVYENGGEKSSNQIFMFNPVTESFEKRTGLPFAIDDQAQAVWKDSLLYVISGWSDSVNVNFVQVYNPVTDEWKLATPLPNTKHAKLFGGCAVITGDTIYYTGGAMFQKNYPPNNHFWKGCIDAKDPYTIHWIDGGEHPGPYRYRAGMFTEGKKIYIAGGSNQTYNYNGISYEHKKPVSPNASILVYEINTGKFELLSFNSPVMDIRSVVTAGKNQFLIAGGMVKGQKLSAGVRQIRTKKLKRIKK
jgi:N-acetylneuraminic acid mutarotase